MPARMRAGARRRARQQRGGHARAPEGLQHAQRQDVRHALAARARRPRRHLLRRVRRRGVRRVQSGRPVRAAPACEPCAGRARCACAASGPPGGGRGRAEAALACTRVLAAGGAPPKACMASSAPWSSAVELEDRPTSAVRPPVMPAPHGCLQDLPLKCNQPSRGPARRDGRDRGGALAAGARQAPARLSSRRLFRPSSARSCASHSRRATSRSVMKPASSPSPPSLLRQGALCCGRDRRDCQVSEGAGHRQAGGGARRHACVSPHLQKAATECTPSLRTALQ